MDQSKKTMRHFYCRDVLWETFEQMANDFDCSIDYLVNEAMRYYARSKNYQSPGAPQMTGGAPQVPGNSQPNAYPPKGAGPSVGPGRGPAPGTQPPPTGATNAPMNRTNRPPPQPTPGYVGANANPVPGMGGGRNVSMGAGPASASMNGPSIQPHAPPANNMPQMGSAGPTLFLIYNGQRYPVTKD